MGHEHDNRRIFLTAGAGALLAACASATASPGKAPGPKGSEEEVSPVEDLMREHGVLRRVLLVYEEIVRRAERRETFPLDVLASSAGLIRRFVEDYHEKLEEDHVFPRFERANKLVDLVTVLREQHQAGRRLTDAIMAHAGNRAGAEHPQFVAPIRAYVRMYAPHAAREDTVLFPELRPLVGAKEYDALGEVFEEKEHELFGAKGFEGMVAQVAQLEQALGIYDLSSFTPR